MARRAVIDGQLRVNGINDVALLAAVAAIPREDFVPEERRAVAYIDRAIPLARDRALNPPLSNALLIAEAAPAASDRALLIGGNGGYVAALLSRLVGSLHVVEADDALTPSPDLRAGEWISGPLAEGNAGAAPYSLILIDGAIEQVPTALADQLADDGRLVTGLVERGVTRLALGRKAGGRIALTGLIEADFAPLAEFAAPRAWSF